MADAIQAKIGVLVYGWTGQAENPRAVDGEGINTDVFVHPILDAIHATKSPIRVAFHIEPYVGRNAASVADDLDYLHGNYFGKEDVIYSIDGKPVVYIYDSYRTPATEWASVFACDATSSSSSPLCVRGDPSRDVFVFGLCLDRGCVRDAATAGFDGIYTYFASDGTSYGATTSSWASLVKDAHAAGLVVSLSVGPGYDDTRIRPWNGAATRDRKGGAYYDAMWDAALAAGADYVSITSFNEWGEGTQIEPAVPRSGVMHSEYYGYGDLYLDRTAYHVDRFSHPPSDPPNESN